MKILAWNCNQAFRKKVDRLAELAPDLAVISECESLEKLQDAHAAMFSQGVWVGNNPHKGLGVFATAEYELKIHPAYTDELQWVVPVQVSGAKSFILLAVWTKNHKESKKSYIGQLYLALEHYRALLQDETVLIAGDFNSNVFWDHLPRVGNHSTVVNMLKEYGIFSAYHFHFEEAQGEESRPTYFFHYDRNKGYHIDYVFAPMDWLEHLDHVSVGTYDDWRPWSDHVPVAVGFRESLHE